RPNLLGLGPAIQDPWIDSAFLKSDLSKCFRHPYFQFFSTGSQRSGLAVVGDAICPNLLNESHVLAMAYTDFVTFLSGELHKKAVVGHFESNVTTAIAQIKNDYVTVQQFDDYLLFP